MRESIAAMTLTEFLLARITEDEFAGTHFEQMPAQWTTITVYPHDGEPIPVKAAMFASTRILAECEAKRKIVDMAISIESHEHAATSLEYGNDDLSTIPVAIAAHETMIDVLELLALPYADHPDYLSEWKQ